MAPPGPTGAQAKAPDSDTIALPVASLDRLMPMYLWLNDDGNIAGTGSTFRKLLPPELFQGQPFLDIFQIRRPRDVPGIAALSDLAGQRLHLTLRDGSETTFRGLVVPLAPGQGMLVNLSFGIEVSEAVRRHDLSDADFSPTDLTVEMLYLAEAKSAVMQELHNLNLRLHQAKLTAEEQAMTDTLTGLANRRSMDIVIGRLIQSGTVFGLMHIDLDFFKQVNDSLGHAAGDAVLQRMARILRDETRDNDTVARVGGDEFVLIFPGLAQLDRLNAIAARIIERLSHPIPFEGQHCRVSASIGMTVSSAYFKPRAEQMLSDADRALYASKYDGRSRATVYSPALDDDFRPPDAVASGESFGTVPEEARKA